MTAEGRADQWRAQGQWFEWQPSGSGVPPVRVFHVEMGDPEAPVLLLVHGFPTCSVDWFHLCEILKDRYRVCALDFPGYGFSDKPRNWGYSLARDAELLRHYTGEVIGARSLVVVGHDRGSSVALNLALRRPAPEIEHLVLTNGNIFLPLSNLTTFQRRVLDPATAPAVLEVLTPQLLAQGMGTTTFSPARGDGDPDVDALADTFSHGDGVGVLHETIQYLVERADHEQDWLGALTRSEVPTTVIWGLEDTISPPRVATHVWSTSLMTKPGRNRIYLIPDANHYLQVDQPERLASALAHALDPGSSPAPGPLAPEPGSPILMDCSRERLLTGREILREG